VGKGGFNSRNLKILLVITIVIPPIRVVVHKNSLTSPTMYMYQRRAAVVSVGHCCVCFCQPVHTLSRTYKTVRVRLVKLVFVSRQKRTWTLSSGVCCLRVCIICYNSFFSHENIRMSFGLSSSALVSGAAVDRQRRERKYGGSGTKKFRYSTAR